MKNGTVTQTVEAGTERQIECPARAPEVAGSSPAGSAALEAFELAKKLMLQGRYDEALAVPMRRSDRNLIEQRIARIKSEAPK